MILAVNIRFYILINYYLYPNRIVAIFFFFYYKRNIYYGTFFYKKQSRYTTKRKLTKSVFAP